MVDNHDQNAIEETECCEDECCKGQQDQCRKKNCEDKDGRCSDEGDDCSRPDNSCCDSAEQIECCSDEEDDCCKPDKSCCNDEEDDDCCNDDDCNSCSGEGEKDNNEKKSCCDDDGCEDEDVKEPVWTVCCEVDETDSVSIKVQTKKLCRVHKVLRLRPSKRTSKAKDNCACDDKCVDRFAKALCEKECHTDEVCTAHENVANHYSSFLNNQREILWRCICSVIAQLEMNTSCCGFTTNQNLTASGSGYSFLYPGAAQNSHSLLRRRRRHTQAHAHEGHDHAHFHSYASAHGHGHGHSDKHTHTGHHDHHSQGHKNHDHSHGHDGMDEKAGAHFIERSDLEAIPTPEKLNMSIKGMTCSSCEKKAIRSLEKMPGVSSVAVNFLFGKGQVEYYAELTSPVEITVELQRMTGFKVSVLRSDDSAYYFLTEKEVPDAQRYKDVFKVNYDPVSMTAREKMKSLGLEMADVLPLLLSEDEDATKYFGIAIDSECKRMFAIFFIAITLTIPILVLSWGSFRPSTELTRQSVCLALATVIQIVCGRTVYMSVYYTIRNHYDLDSDCLVALSTSIAYVYSLVAFILHRRGMLLDEDEIYESSSLLLTLVLFSKAITVVIRRMAADQVKFDIYQPTTMRLESNESELVPASLLQLGDRIVLNAGDQAVTDGVIVSGQGEFEESHINGEYLPTPKKRGGDVLAGANVVNGSVVYRATRLVPENSVSNIKILVNSVSSFRTRSSDLVEMVAKYLTPIMLGVAAVVFMIWTLVGTNVRHQSTANSIATAITYAIATLAVACPCALVLVVPLALSIGVAAGKNSYGILLKSASPTTAAGKVKHVVFDKTGTLTTDALTVEDALLYDVPGFPVQDLVRAVVSNNTHPISRAVASHLNQFGVGFAQVGEIENVVGSGMRTTFAGKPILCGKPAFCGIKLDGKLKQIHDAGCTLFCVSVARGPTLAVFGITATIRPDCPAVLKELKARRITVHVLSGDTLPAVQKICRDLDIADYAAETSPEGKGVYIEALKSADSKVLFCGDGANDAVALAQADIGLSMTTDGITLAAADACVLNSEVAGVLAILDLATKLNRRVIFGVSWACVYQFFAILVVAGAFVKVRIGPAWAGVSEVISILPVFVAAMSMKLTKPRAVT
ncbi:E1-E2 ATPase-domain-containing protein [Lipomyces arxii]|uniref:E1-E2 ATPase-domain-containing protein n=1 Tax=Lipomyces arxii TaxID=56418 RepID=UPI0034CD5072